MKIITFSIAAYNVEKYLRDTLSSFVIDDTEMMDQFEVIIVNDGSKDNTLQIAREFENKYPKTFRVIDKENGGYGSTINASLKKAEGKYFKLVDGDDWVDKHELVKFITAIREIDVDMIITKYNLVNEVTQDVAVVDRGLIYDSSIIDFDCICKQDAIEMHMIAFRTDILVNHNIQITENCYYTDVEYILRPIPYINHLCCIDVVLYQYRIGRDGQSVSISSWMKNINMATKVAIILCEFYDGIVKKDINEFKKRYIKRRVVDSTLNKYRVFLMFPQSRDVFQRIREYDSKVKAACSEIYKEKDIITTLLRSNNYSIYCLLSRIYRTHIKNK